MSARPGLDVLLRVADDRRLAGGSARGVDADDVLHRRSEHAERIVCRRSSFVVKGNLAMSASRSKIVRMNAGGVELLPIGRDAFIGVAERILQAHELERANLVDAGLFDRLDTDRPPPWGSSSAGEVCLGRRAPSRRAGLPVHMTGFGMNVTSARPTAEGSQTAPVRASEARPPRRLFGRANRDRFSARESRREGRAYRRPWARRRSGRTGLPRRSRRAGGHRRGRTRRG